MNPSEIARLFHDGQLFIDQRPILAEKALLTPRSLLLFSPTHVYKLRRPLQYGPLDQRTLAQRFAQHARERWVGLKLNPEAYLPEAVLRPPRQPASHPLEIQLHGLEGEPLIVMHRYADALRALDIFQGEDHQYHLGRASRGLEDLLARLAQYHAHTECETSPLERGTQRAHQRLDSQLGALAAHLSADSQDALLDAFRACIAHHQQTLQHRVLERRHRILHGHVSLEHIFFEGRGLMGAVLLGASGLDDESRLGDTAEDLAPLYTELQALGHDTIADSLVVAYARETQDSTLTKILPLYQGLYLLDQATEESLLGDAADPERLRYLCRRALTLAQPSDTRP